MATVGFKGLI